MASGLKMSRDDVCDLLCTCSLTETPEMNVLPSILRLLNHATYFSDEVKLIVIRDFSVSLRRRVSLSCAVPSTDDVMEEIEKWFSFQPSAVSKRELAINVDIFFGHEMSSIFPPGCIENFLSLHSISQ